MRLAETVGLRAGGPGSGCRGENCGRPKELGSAESSSKLIKNRGVDGGWMSNGHKLNVFVRGKKIGEAGVTEHSRKGKKIWTVTTTRVNSSLVGKGFGRHVYVELLKQAVANGVSVFRSSGSRLSPGSQHAWNRLKESFPVKKEGKHLQISLKAYSEMGEPPTGVYSHGHIEPITWFRPPSLTQREKDNSERIPTDDPKETNDRFLDVTKRNSKDTREQRMKLLRRSKPGGLPPLIPVRTTAVAPHQGVYTPMAGLYGQGERPMIKQRPARMYKQAAQKVSYGRQGCI